MTRWAYPIYRCKLTNNYGEVGYSNEMTVTVLVNETLGRTPVYILPAVNEAAPDPATLWPDKVIDVYDLQDETSIDAAYNVTAGGYFQAEAFYSVIPGDKGYILEMPSGTQKNLYYADFDSDKVDTAVMGTITYKWEATTEVDQWGFPTKYTELGTDPIINFSIPEGVETYWGRLTITNTIGTGDNVESKSSYVEITFHVDQPGVGTAVSGSVVSYGEDDPVTVQLIKEGTSEPAYETKVSGGTQSGNKYTASYSFSDVPTGTYTMKVIKSKHVTREYSVTVGTEAVVKDVEIWRYGDVTGDGIVNAADATQIDRKFNSKVSVFGSADAEIEAYRFLVGNVNAADGIINAADAMQIKRFFNNKPSIIDTIP